MAFFDLFCKDDEHRVRQLKCRRERLMLISPTSSNSASKRVMYSDKHSEDRHHLHPPIDKEQQCNCGLMEGQNPFSQKRPLNHPSVPPNTVPPSPSPSLCLSFPLSHTHTHIDGVLVSVLAVAVVVALRVLLILLVLVRLLAVLVLQGGTDGIAERAAAEKK